MFVLTQILISFASAINVSIPKLVSWKSILLTAYSAVDSAWGFRRSKVEVLPEIHGGDESVLSDFIGAVVT